VRPNYFILILLSSFILGCPQNITPPVDAGVLGGGSGGGESAGAGGGNTNSGGGTVSTDAGSDAGTSVDAGLSKSTKAILRFKGPERISNDFAAALGLPANVLCNELGLYSCTSAVHTLALGGVDPYGNGVYEPASLTGVTAPLVVDRIALSACTLRTNLDAATPAQAQIFKGIFLTTAGKISDLNAASIRGAIEELYKRVLLRLPSEVEVARLKQLAVEIEATPSQTPGIDWMKTACFTVLSSTESILY
jgi:hypothetical protein